MASNRPPVANAPAQRFPPDVPGLVNALEALKVANPKATRSNVHLYPASVYAPEGSSSGHALPDRHITSWKMTEHMYFNKDNGFPTLARGLFVEPVTSADQVPPSALKSYGQGAEIKERIVARGYDKFFNTNEMAWTNWDAMEKHSAGPYHLTLKSNGCLILISALSPTHLVVASKHSLGTTTAETIVDKLKDVSIEEKSPATSDQEKDTDDKESKSHAEMGRLWVGRSLKAKGKTTEELAKRLWDDNVTAVLELCDDSFEEHVIATPEHWTGLHLHGLNYNTPLFATKPPDEVSAFARDFGFIETKHFSLDSIAEVKRVTDKLAETGSWEGEMIEGFVVRSTVKDVEGDVAGRPPYKPGAPFFFKVKFEEPYLLYRQWREVTRTLLSILKPGTTPAKEEEVWKKVRSRIKRPEVGVYAEWCMRMIKEQPRLFDNYERGVVRVRERFLEWIEKDGKATWEAAKEGKWKPSMTAQLERNKAEKDAELADLPKKWIVVPIAVPGSGKTTIGVALSKLFGFAHTQSDDILSKNTAPTFKRNIVELLKKNNVVFADRNNHIDKHYNEIYGLRDEKGYAKILKPYNVRLVGLVWNVDALPYHRLLRLCSERVVNRGDNHSTLRPDLTADAEHEAVVGSFLHRFTTPDPLLFDSLITIDIEDDQRAALGSAVNGLVKALGLTAPSEKDIDEALAAAGEFKTNTPFHGGARIGKDVRYFGLAPEVDLNFTIDDALATDIPVKAAASAKQFVASLREKSRVTQKPHITLSHNKNVAAEKEAAAEGSAPGPQEVAWTTCKSLAEAGISPLYDFDISHLVWDDRVMALVVGNLQPQKGVDRDAGVAVVLPQEVEENLHITVGTQNEEISAFESRGVVRVAREAIARGANTGDGGESVAGGGAVHWVAVGPLKGSGRIRGMY
ncbi:tRNA ligase [Vanrija albida]|uniref:tRNA ligase n=1 Tax=Vanrija albida TaxID=181172 RepID=A0ABR3Q1T0_9TREE